MSFIAIDITIEYLNQSTSHKHKQIDNKAIVFTVLQFLLQYSYSITKLQSLCLNP